MTIYEILEKKKEEIKEAKSAQPVEEIKKIIAFNESNVIKNKQDNNRNFLESLKKGNNDPSSLKRTRIIAEIKRASPSKGMLKKEFVPKDIAKIYQDHNASAISVLTTRFGFDGDIKYLQEVRDVASIPILRKDFIFDEYQIYESIVSGADAILLIASILDKYQLCDYRNLANELGMDALIEVHSLEELEKTIDCDAEIIGINNRNLKTFEVDINTTVNLAKEIPQGKIIVSESGIKTRNDIELLESKGVNAFLIGTTFMKSDNIGNELDALLGHGS